MPGRSETETIEKYEVRTGLKRENGEFMTRPGAIVGGVAIVGLLFMAVVLIWTIADSSQLGGKIFLLSAIGSLTLPLLLIWLVARVYTDSEGITCRNALGFQKTIPWDEIKAAYTASNMGDIKVCGETSEITIYTYFKESDIIEDVVRKHCPEAFRIDSWIDSPVVPKGYRKKNGPLVFGLRKFLAPIFFVSLAVLAAGVFNSDSSIPAVLVPLFLGFIILLILINICVLLNCVVLRIALDSKSVQFRNFIGMKKRILWKDIESCEAYTEGGTDYIKLCSRVETIKISQNFSGWQLIGKIINRYSPKKPRRRKNKKRA